MQKFKRNQEVIATASRNGKQTTGRYHGTASTEGRGSWIEVNVADKGKTPIIKRFRPSTVSAAQ